ncbi:MAG: hypothetical protein ACXU99_07235, partial [Thermodesulfobacteriota bacterium]
METEKSTSIAPFSTSWIRSLIHQKLAQTGLKTKITLLIVFIVVGVLLLVSYLDYHFARKDQIDLYLDRNLYIAKQIDASISDRAIREDLPHVRDEVEEWLLSRPFLTEIDLFLFSPRGWDLIVS